MRRSILFILAAMMVALGSLHPVFNLVLALHGQRALEHEHQLRVPRPKRHLPRLRRSMQTQLAPALEQRHRTNIPPAR
ncbi:MAG: hypothetical protein JWL62_1020 [Hyphomicrobiales bacterium]|nr:hypothetical protein [Hyphomicrobiales bacterium]